jgi:hypothetical protein
MTALGLESAVWMPLPLLLAYSLTYLYLPLALDMVTLAAMLAALLLMHLLPSFTHLFAGSPVLRRMAHRTLIAVQDIKIARGPCRSRRFRASQPLATRSRPPPW